MTTVKVTPTHPSFSHPVRRAGLQPRARPPNDKPQCREAQAPTGCTTQSDLPSSYLSRVQPRGDRHTLGPPKGSFRTGAAMSQFSTMTTRERQMQAAAICREVEAQEAIEMDLGKKINTPKDIMLEELSLASNRGSRLFKMRQRRSEKYTFESMHNENNKQLNSMIVIQPENGSTTDNHSGENNVDVDQPPPVPSDTPDTSMEPNPDSIAPGYGGPLKDMPPERFNCTAVPKSYHSPWEQAITGDPALADMLITNMAQPEPRADLPGFKSFNRVATPFGGFGKASRPAPTKSLLQEPLPNYPELQGDTAVDRPSFNRSALGWVSRGGPIPLTAVSLEPMLVPESEDL
ncbi:LOW QUALITY PROTEIN: myozenin-2a [Spinachia spinachia]